MGEAGRASSGGSAAKRSFSASILMRLTARYEASTCKSAQTVRRGHITAVTHTLCLPFSARGTRRSADSSRASAILNGAIERAALTAAGLRLGEFSTSASSRESTEFLPYTFLAEPGDWVDFTDGFFCIDSGCTLVLALFAVRDARGVASKPFEGNVIGRLRGIGECIRGGVEGGGGRSLAVLNISGLTERRVSDASASGGRVGADVREEGRGEGLRGPMGREVSGREVDRE